MQIVKFAEGGRVGSNSLMPGNDSVIFQMLAVSQETLKQSQQQLQESKQINIALLQSTSDLTNQLAGGIRADVNVHKLDEARAQIKRIKDDAGLK